MLPFSSHLADALCESGCKYRIPFIPAKFFLDFFKTLCKPGRYTGSK